MSRSVWFQHAYDSTDPTKTWLGPRYLGKITAGNTSVKVKGTTNTPMFAAR